MKYTPKPKNNSSSVISLALLLSGAVLMIASRAIANATSGIIQLLAVIFMTASIFILIRYRMTEFTYSITPRNSEPGVKWSADEYSYSESDFVVERKQGRRVPIVEARLSLGDLSEIRLENKGESTAHEGVVRRYNYTVTFPRDERYVMIFDDPVQGRIAVFAELDREMADALAKAAQANKSN